MLSKEDILDYLRNNLSKFKSKYEVNEIGLFGSYAKGIQCETSDIDLIVDMPSKVRDFFALKYELENYFNKDIDIINRKSLRLLVESEIQKEIIYA